MSLFGNKHGAPAADDTVQGAGKKMVTLVDVTKPAVYRASTMYIKQTSAAVAVRLLLVLPSRRTDTYIGIAAQIPPCAHRNVVLGELVSLIFAGVEV